MADQLTLSTRLFSMEMMGSVIVSVVLISGVWFGLSAAVQANDEGIEQVQSKQHEMERKLNRIGTDVEVIKANQQAQKQRAARQENATQRILDILQATTHNNHNNHNGGN